jgi:hypothetical protein
MWARVAWRNSCFARADARTAATSDNHAITAREAKTSATAITPSRTSDQSAPSAVTDTITSDSSRACAMTRIAVKTPRTTARTMKPLVLRA